MSVIDEIKSRIDIVTYIEQYVPLKRGGRNYKACCPFHSEKTPSFVVDPDRQSWRCYGACATGGDVLSFAQRYHGWDFKETLRELASVAGVELTPQSPEQRQQGEHDDKLRALLQLAADIFHQQLTQSQAGAQALHYARHKRAFTKETIQHFQIGYALQGWQNTLKALQDIGHSQADIIDAGLAIRNEKGRIYDRFRDRLMIPIRDGRGRVVAFGARALNPDDTPKYLNSPQTPVFDKSQVLFGLDTGKDAIRSSETAVIVEGYMDAIQAQQAGFGNVVAQMGTAMTEAQLKLIAPRMAKRIILALDADAAGQNATMRSLEVARSTLASDFAGRLQVDIRVLQIPGAKDPDDLIRETPEQWQSLVDNAMPVADFVIMMESARLPHNPSLQEREAVARRVLPILTASESDLYRQDNVQRLAMRLRIPERELLLWAEEEKQAAARAEAKRVQRAQASPRIQAQAPPPASPISPPSTKEDGGPPPLDYEALEPPPNDDMQPYDPPATRPEVPPPAERAATTQPAPLPSRTSQDSSYALEAFCLRWLLLKPELLFLFNRRVRELAAPLVDDGAALADGPLGELSVQDFEHGDYRAIFQVFKLGLRQGHQNIDAFLKDSLDPSLIAVVERLMQAEGDQVRTQMRQRFDGDASASWQHFEQRVLPFVDHDVEVSNRLLQLRLRRLEHELAEQRFLQMSAQQTGEAVNHERLVMQIMRAARAVHAINAALA